MHVLEDPSVALPGAHGPEPGAHARAPESGDESVPSQQSESSEAVPEERATRHLALVGFLIAAAVVAVMALVSAREVMGVLDDEANLARYYRAMSEVDDLEFKLSEAVSGYRGYVLAQDRYGLLGYQRVVNAIPAQVAIVRGELFEQDPERWARFESALNASLATMSAEVALRQTYGGHTQRVAEQSVLMNERVMDLLQELDQREQVRLGQVEGRNGTRLPWLWTAIALLAAGLAGALAVLYRLIRGSERRARDTLVSLGESEERFRALTELSSDWYWAQDEQLRFVDISGGLARKMGIHRERILGYTRWETNADLISAEQRERLDGIMSRREVFRDFVLQRRADDGSVRTIAISGAPVFAGGGAFRGYRGVGRDITEQERLRTALQRSEERLRLATEFGHIGIWEREFPNDVIHWSPNVAAMFGLSDRRTTFTAEQFQERLHPEDRERERVARRAWLAGQRDYNVEHRVLGPDGKVRWLHQRGNMYRDAAGLPVRTFGVVQDITTRKIAEERLRESEQRFRTLTDLSADWYWEQDEQLRFTFFSDGAYERLGQRARTALGRTRWECPASEVSGGWEAHRADLVARRPFRELMIQDFDERGNPRWLCVSGTPVFDREQRFKGYRGIGQDVTQRVGVAQALKESEARFRALTAVSSDWYWEQDDEFRFTLISENAYRVLKRLPGSPIGQRRWEMPQLHPVTGDWEEHKRTLAEHRMFRDFAVHDRDGEGNPHVLAISGAPIFDGDGSFRGYRGTAQDVTDRTLAEQALRESEERFRLLAENMRDVFWIYSFERRRFDYVGGSYEQVWGQPREALYADAGAYRKLIAPEHVAAVDAARERQRRGEPVEVEFQIRQPSGQLRWVLARSSPMTNSRGERLVCGISEDITERKLREQRRIDESLRQRDALVREVHHRIKNNLQGVVGLLRKHAKRSGVASSVLEAAIQQVQSIALVHGLQGEHSLGGVALSEIVEAVARMQGGLTERVIRVENADGPSGSILVAEGEAVGVALVLNELINNAAKHATLNRASTVTVRVEREATRVLVRVRNHGRLPDGFDYVRGKQVGTGLGLVKALVPTDGGQIAFFQKGAVVEVTMTLSAPVLVAWTLTADRPALSAGG